MTKVKICGLRRDEDISIVNDYMPDYAGFIIDFPASFRSLPHEEVKNLTVKLDKSITSVGVFVDSPIEIVIELLKEGVIEAAQLHGSESPEYIMKVQEATGKPVIKSFVLPKKDVSQRQDSQDFAKAASQKADDCPPTSLLFKEDILQGQETQVFGGTKLKPHLVEISEKNENKELGEVLLKPQTSNGTDSSAPENSASAKHFEDELRWRAEEILEASAASPADMILLDAGKGSGQTFNWNLLSGFTRPYFLAGGISEGNICHAIGTLHPYAVDISSSVEIDRFKDRQKVKNIIEIARKGSTK